MAKKVPLTVGDMRREAVVTDDEISAAVEGYLTNPKQRLFEFTSGHVLDIGAAIAQHRPAKAALAGQITSDAYRRKVVRAAVILAMPTKG